MEGIFWDPYKRVPGMLNQHPKGIPYMAPYWEPTTRILTATWPGIRPHPVTFDLFNATLDMADFRKSRVVSDDYPLDR